MLKGCTHTAKGPRLPVWLVAPVQVIDAVLSNPEDKTHVSLVVGAAGRLGLKQCCNLGQPASHFVL